MNYDDQILHRNKSGIWKICVGKHRNSCEDKYSQTSNTSVPNGGSGWKDETTSTSITILIEEPVIFENCKNYGENISASVISYSNTTKCFYSMEPFVKIARDISSTLFIYEKPKIHGNEWRSGVRSGRGDQLRYQLKLQDTFLL